MNPVPFLIIVPLAAAFFIPILGKRIKMFAETVCILATLSLAAISFFIAFSMRNERLLMYNIGNWAVPAGIPLIVDSLSMFMLLIVNVIAFLVSIYASNYVRRYTDTWKFFSLFMLMIAGMNGFLISGDLFNMYVCLEMASIAAYALVAFGVRAEELEASFKYTVMGAAGSSFILLGIAILYSYTSTLNMADMARAIAIRGASNVVPFVSALFLVGFGLKAALIPFHAWLPDAHSSAPTPVSAVLSGLLIKVLGIYAISRVFFNIFGINAQTSLVLIILAVASMVAAGILAFGQDNIKRMLAYSSISQVGYVALGLGVGTPLAILGALFHLFNHSISKSLLFLNAGAVEDIGGTRSLKDMPGVLSRSPVTGYTNIIGAMSISGIPPLGGFWSKIIIIFACIQAGRPVLAFIAIAVSMLTLGYYFKATTRVLFGSKHSRACGNKTGRIPLALAVPMVVLAVISIISIFMLLPNMGRTFMGDAIAILVRGEEYAGMVLGAMK